MIMINLIKRLGGIIGVSWLLLSCTVQADNGTSPLRLGVHTLQADDWALQQAQASRFDTIVQVFAWREIEPTQGEFHWEVTDQVVAGAAYYGLDLIVRLDQQPAWASSSGVEFNAPPDDLDDYTYFVSQVVQRYRGQIKGYIIWNEPNLAIDWGGLPPDPAGYVALLKKGYEAIKAADPAALVVLAGLAPTNNQDEIALDDRIYLTQMYEAGAAAFFDVLAAHPYGASFPPDAPLEANQGLVMRRLAELREIMLTYQDAHTPIWITELGWTIDPPPEQPHFQVTPEQQADYLVQAQAYIETEWPWVELLTIWNLSRLEAGHPFAGYSLFEAGGQPRPAYEAWQKMAQDIPQAPVQTSQSDQVAILSKDVRIHLGDTDFKPPWWPLFAGHNPSLVWEGGFYLADPGDQDWILRLEIMQQNEVGSILAINGHRISPDLPQQGFSRRWLTVARIMPVALLRPGYNELSVTTVRVAPDMELDDFVWGDFQLRHVRLSRISP